ncbi:hypothetical protein ACFL27_06020 [candidate division CSSED10-310 bacterium]|uniref:ATP synthase subunit b n=1 Tax=candidate division CSSED10-310 bacterium TaxID=2855610 RepID=A0ABV6YU64_UNCC1
MKHKCLVFLIMAVLILLMPLLVCGEQDSHSPAEPEAEHGEHHGAPWYKSMDLWKTINLAVLFFVLYKLLAVPISRFLSERTAQIDESLRNAENEKNEAHQNFEDMNERLTTAKDEIEAIITRGQEDAAKAITEIKENSALEIVSLKQQIADTLAQEVAKSKKELISFVASQAISQAREKITQLDTKKLQTDYLKKFHEHLKPQGGNGEGSKTD